MNIDAVLPRLLAIFALTISFLTSAHAGDATWDQTPTSGDWNTATNWTPATVPNGSADTATFGVSNTTDVSISANTTVNGITFTSAAMNPYTITASPGFTLTISGVGITNNSGVTQNFVTAGHGPANRGQIVFNNSATAGSITTFTNNGSTFAGTFGGLTEFFNSSTAGNSTITNNSAPVGAPLGASGGLTEFFNSSTAGNSTIINNGGIIRGPAEGGTLFFDSSTASSATINNNSGTVSDTGSGFTEFLNSATAGNATINNNSGTVSDAGSTRFADSATAGNATINNNGATVMSVGGGVTGFGENSTAGDATINNNGATVGGAVGGETLFFGASTAGNATINNNGGTVSGAGGGITFFSSFFDTSIASAGAATLIANGGVGGGQGGAIFFEHNSTGGTSRVEVFGNGSLDISLHDPPSQKFPGVPVGSVEGDGNVFLGANNLIVGTNNTSTTFSGVIQDGGQNGGIGGSLTKIGTGTLDLTGANTYTGNTNINRGVLKVDGSVTSNTFVNDGGTLAGTGTVIGNVTNNHGGTVSPGDASGGTLTVNSYTTQMGGGTLLIDIAGPNTGQFSVLDVLGNANLNPIALLLPVLQNGFVPTVGESFTFMNYSDLTGTFFIFDRNIDNVMEHWDVTYQSTYATLTVAPGNVSVPDHASTLLLLTLSLLGLVMCRHGLLRKQA